MAYHVQPASGVKNLQMTIGSTFFSCEYSAGRAFSSSFVNSFICVPPPISGNVPASVHHLLGDERSADKLPCTYPGELSFPVGSQQLFLKAVPPAVTGLLLR